jgi:hypothetical protein
MMEQQKRTFKKSIPRTPKKRKNRHTFQKRTTNTKCVMMGERRYQWTKKRTFTIYIPTAPKETEK